MKQNYLTRNQNYSDVGVAVQLRAGESFESLMKRFKKKVSKSGILFDLKEKMFHESKGERLRRKKQISLRRTNRENLTEEIKNENSSNQ